MAMTKAKVASIRDNAERLLAKMEAEEKDEWKKLAREYENVKVSTDKIIGMLSNTKTEAKMAVMLKQLKRELGDVIKVTRPDFSPLMKSIMELQKSVTTYMMDVNSRDKSGELLKTMREINKELKKPKSDRTEEIVKAIQSLQFDPPKFPEEIEMSNLNELAQLIPIPKYPNPVTNININALRGYVHTTNQTLTTSRATLPGYGVLDNRRSVMVFNNDSSETIYIGGTGVTASNGFPILSQTFSPSIDAGETMILYGLTSSGTADVRVIEISNIATGR
jgi:gas vesicle protein